MTKKLAIMDYGVGGLDLFTKINTDFPALDITYFSDSGAIPYGKLTRKALNKRVTSVLNFLKTQGCSTVIVACHSASTVAQSISGVEVIPMIPWTKRCVLNQKFASVAVIGGGRTIRSGIYRDHLQAHGIRVKQRVAQQLSIMVEAGITDEQQNLEAVYKIVNPVKNVEALLLACTHYPVLTPYFRSCMNPNCHIIDPMDFMYQQLKNQIASHDMGTHTFFTSGNRALMKTVARNIYHLDMKDVLQTKIDFTS